MSSANNIRHPVMPLRFSSQLPSDQNSTSRHKDTGTHAFSRHLNSSDAVSPMLSIPDTATSRERQKIPLKAFLISEPPSSECLLGKPQILPQVAVFWPPNGAGNVFSDDKEPLRGNKFAVTANPRLNGDMFPNTDRCEGLPESEKTDFTSEYQDIPAHQQRIDETDPNIKTLHSSHELRYSERAITNNPPPVETPSTKQKTRNFQNKDDKFLDNQKKITAEFQEQLVALQQRLQKIEASHPKSSDKQITYHSQRTDQKVYPRYSENPPSMVETENQHDHTGRNITENNPRVLTPRLSAKAEVPESPVSSSATSLVLLASKPGDAPLSTESNPTLQQQPQPREAASKVECAQLQRKEYEARADIHVYQKKLSELERIIDNSERQQKQLETQWVKSQDDYHRMFSQLNMLLINKEQQFQSLQERYRSELDQQTTILAERERELQELNEQLEALEINKKKAESENNEISAMNERLTTETKEKDRQIQITREELEQLRQEQRVVENSHQETKKLLTDQISKLQEDLKIAQDKRLKLDLELRTQRAAVNKASNDITDYQQTLTKLQTKIDKSERLQNQLTLQLAWSKQADLNQATKQQLTREISGLKEQLASEKQQISAVRTALQTKKSEFEQQTSILAERDHELQERNKQLIALEIKKKDVEGVNDEISAMNERLTAETNEKDREIKSIHGQLKQAKQELRDANNNHQATVQQLASEISEINELTKKQLEAKEAQRLSLQETLAELKTKIDNSACLQQQLELQLAMSKQADKKRFDNLNQTLAEKEQMLKTLKQQLEVLEVEKNKTEEALNTMHQSFSFDITKNANQIKSIHCQLELVEQAKQKHRDADNNHQATLQQLNRQIIELKKKSRAKETQILELQATLLTQNAATELAHDKLQRQLDKESARTLQFQKKLTDQEKKMNTIQASTDQYITASKELLSTVQGIMQLQKVVANTLHSQHSDNRTIAHFIQTQHDNSEKLDQTIQEFINQTQDFLIFSKGYGGLNQQQVTNSELDTERKQSHRLGEPIDDDGRASLEPAQFRLSVGTHPEVGELRSYPMFPRSSPQHLRRILKEPAVELLEERTPCSISYFTRLPRE